MSVKEVMHAAEHGTAERKLLFWRSNDGMI
jgi:hypothetical protein